MLPQDGRQEQIDRVLPIVIDGRKQLLVQSPQFDFRVLGFLFLQIAVRHQDGQVATLIAFQDVGRQCALREENAGALLDDGIGLVPVVRLRARAVPDHHVVALLGKGLGQEIERFNLAGRIQALCQREAVGRSSRPGRGVLAAGEKKREAGDDAKACPGE